VAEVTLQLRSDRPSDDVTERRSTVRGLPYQPPSALLSASSLWDLGGATEPNWQVIAPQTMRIPQNRSDTGDQAVALFPIFGRGHVAKLQRNAPYRLGDAVTYRASR
jgi:hypothetical protein